MTLYHKPLVKSAPDLFRFIANLETLCSELHKDVSVDFIAHCGGPYILACISKSFLQTLREVCDTGHKLIGKGFLSNTEQKLKKFAS